MTISGFDHLQVAMPAGAEADARAFYAALLGLVEVEKPAPLQARGGCWFNGPGFALHLGVETSFSPARKAHPAFLTTDLDELAPKLTAAGHPVQWDEALPGVRRFYTADPFGNRIEIIQADDGGFSDRQPAL
ncbi:MAG: hypothetical protein KDE28_08325 [Anaerolineales bacterium]|nr:hypothetical protein [Anaerolineales bacterium]